MGKNLTLTKVEKQLGDNDVYYTIDFLVGNVKQTIRCRSEELRHELNTKGYPISSQQMSTLNDYIVQQNETIEVKHVHSDIGWCKSENKIIFKGHEALGIESDYIGNLAIEPNGNVSDFATDYDKTIYGNIPLEASIIMGLSACVVGYLSVVVGDVAQPSIIFDINGKSTTGKTTCARLAVSMCGSIKKQHNKVSLSSTCSTTLNALYGQLKNNFGYTVLLKRLGLEIILITQQ